MPRPDRFKRNRVSGPFTLTLPAVAPAWSALHSLHYQFLANQQIMLEDTQRTGLYHSGIVDNPSDFAGRTVLDVGAGTGILSLFAAQAGARKVYACEGTSSSEYARALVDHAGLGERIEIVQTPLDELVLPEKVDVIISEPWGFFLFHERMVETFIRARDRFLVPGGKMFPTTGQVWLAPFCDPQLYESRIGKLEFWHQKNYYGVDLTCLASRATEELFAMPAVGPFEARALMATPVGFPLDFQTIRLDELAQIELPFDFVATENGQIHGLAGWFEVSFDGRDQRVLLSTAPDATRTHWSQVRFVFIEPIPVRTGEHLKGCLVLEANSESSYDVLFEGELAGVKQVRQNFLLHAHFWWYEGD
jgi:histone-arginine methyltransferase CARM1